MAIAPLAADRPLTRGRFAGTYAAVVGVPLLVLFAVLAAGQGLVSAGLPAPRNPAPPPGGQLDVTLLLLQIIVIIAASRLMGVALAALGQPRVVGEMVAGILLGPSVMGVLWPSASAWLFRAGSVRFLNALAQVGLILFMFLVGLQVEGKQLKERGHAAVLTSHASITMPAALGALLSLLLYPKLAPGGVEFTDFTLFVAAAMSVTAFPVLARILIERGLAKSRLGTIALTCAAVDDVTAWCILAGVVVVVRGGKTGVPLWATLAGTALWVALMVTVGRALMRLLLRRHKSEEPTQDLLAAFMLIVIASALVTEYLGIHALFGAFVVGAFVPRVDWLVKGLQRRIEDVMVVLLLPLFFAYTGLRTRIGLIDGGEMWLLCGVVTLVAVAGKLGGTSVAARLTGMRWREAAALGALMNTRGLMELVIINVGYDLGVISRPLFAMMVIMAVATTLMTTPLLSWLQPKPA